MSRRTEKIDTILREQSAIFFERESNRQALITITNSKLSSDNSYATLFVSVLPEKEEEKALEFLRRQVRDLRNYLRTHTKISRIPFITIELDKGEKNRQSLEDIDA